MGFEWYNDIPEDSDIQQGDIIEGCTVIVPNETHYQKIINGNENEDPLDTITINGIIMTQSCDIENDKIDSIIICPIWPLKTLVEHNDFFKSKNGREDLRQGKQPEYHLLQKFESENLPSDYYFVDFRHIYSVPKRIIEAIIKEKSHKRLMPPYREHLSQSFARYFMRVGLPVDIPREEIKNYS